MKSSRVGRIVQILTTLQAGKGCTANELATTFGTSRRDDISRFKGIAGNRRAISL